MMMKQKHHIAAVKVNAVDKRSLSNQLSLPFWLAPTTNWAEFWIFYCLNLLKKKKKKLKMCEVKTTF